jgi:hypothetical protein
MADKRRSATLDLNLCHILNGHQTSTHPVRPPILTDVNPVRYSIDSATPRAQDLQSMLDDGARLRSSSTSSLESKKILVSSQNMANLFRNRRTNRG